jgi:hypothetical protein
LTHTSYHPQVDDDESGAEMDNDDATQDFSQHDDVYTAPDDAHKSDESEDEGVKGNADRHESLPPSPKPLPPQMMSAAKVVASSRQRKPQAPRKPVPAESPLPPSPAAAKSKSARSKKQRVAVEEDKVPDDDDDDDDDDDQPVPAARSRGSAKSSAKSKSAQSKTKQSAAASASRQASSDKQARVIPPPPPSSKYLVVHCNQTYTIKITHPSTIHSFAHSLPNRVAHSLA